MTVFYRVVYEIDVEADSPLAAALVVEDMFTSAEAWHYRPVLGVTGPDGVTHEIDLEDGSEWVRSSGGDLND